MFSVKLSYFNTTNYKITTIAISINNVFTGSRRPSILPVPDMVTSNLNILTDNQDEEVEVDESEDELDDDVPWRSPSEKIA